MSLFKNGEVRSAANYKLKTELLKKVPEAEKIERRGDYVVADGGALM